MKKIIALSTATLILLVALAGCLPSNSSSASASESRDKSRVFLLSGENDFVEIRNGMIILTPELEQFVGGELSFKGEELSGLKDFRTGFYFYLDGDKTGINVIRASIEGSEEGMIINSNLGSTHSETLFSPEDWDTLIDSLYFTLSGTYVTGETFEYSITLNVTEIVSEFALLANYMI